MNGTENLLADSEKPFTRARQAHLRLGQLGEKTAVDLLRELGFTILCRNYAGLYGEIDIIARDAATICFVEVKTRSRAGRARPAAAVKEGKRRKIIKTAHRYLRELGYPGIAYRFDIVEVILRQRRLHEVYYWPNAFSEDPLRTFFEEKFPDIPASYVRLA